jgi:cell pole-organizing protein PopZ
MADTLDGATNNWIRADDAATDYSTCCFEDSLVEPSRKEDSYICRQHELIAEEEEHDSDHSESVEQLSESVSKIEESTLDIGANSCVSDQQEVQSSNSSQANTYKLLKPKYSSSIAKNVAMFNVNNNNSIEKEDIQVLERKTQEKRQRQGTQTKRLNSFGSSTPSLSGESISNCSSSEETEPTRLHILSPSARKACSSPANIASTKSTATQIPVHLMHQSIQTSGYADVNMLKAGSFKLLESPVGTSLVKIILPNVKTLPGESKLGEEVKKPVYVFYPNYTLPDLAFLREKQKDLDVAKIFLMPQKFSPPHFHEPYKLNSQAKSADNKKIPSTGKPRRPFSCNDVEVLRKKGFAHIQDWDSLTFLLPREYRQILAEVPEIVHHLKGKNEDSLQPLFCLSPPLHPRNKISRPVSCDCSSFVTTAEGKPLPVGSNTATNVSSSSSTATQPSSGYRGSSTILTDSSSNHNQSNYNPLFVYRYDSVSSESSLMMNQQKPTSVQQPPSPPLPKRSVSLSTGGEASGSVKHVDSCINLPTPPRPPLPRGILRKSLENNNSSAVHYNCKAHKNSANSKRYSMFELGGMTEVCKAGKNILVQNKRQSLQDADFSEYAMSSKKTTGNCEVAEDMRRRLPSEKDFDEMEDEYDDEGVDAGIDTSLEEGHLDYQVKFVLVPQVFIDKGL